LVPAAYTPGNPHIMPLSRLTVDAITVERGGRIIIDAVSFSVTAGDALVLTGPNGAGKTTLIRALAGFLRPKSGSVRVDGSGDEQELVALSHYVGHRDAIKAKLTVAENVTFWARYLGGNADGAAIDDALDSCGLLDLAGVLATSRLGRSAASAWPACSQHLVRCGCSMSRPPPSTPPISAHSPASSNVIGKAAA
jgi:ABC-type cobalamin/Fe3+-siderophores transport system ATPase subunit